MRGRGGGAQCRAGEHHTASFMPTRGSAAFNDASKIFFASSVSFSAITSPVPESTGLMDAAETPSAVAVCARRAVPRAAEQPCAQTAAVPAAAAMCTRLVLSIAPRVGVWRRKEESLRWKCCPAASAPRVAWRCSRPSTRAVAARARAARYRVDVEVLEYLGTVGYACNF